ncbi:MAG: pyridoxal-phosphate dependent enzyme [Trueperaceae bacterium]
MPRAWFACLECGSTRPLSELYRCPACGGELSIDYDFDQIRESTEFLARWQHAQPFWQRFGPVLPQERLERAITLGEGNTPLVKSKRLAEKLGLTNLFFKLESTNPTGSFKDRQMVVAMSKANEWGRTRFGTASSGNVGIALSAYAARAGFEAFVWVSEGTAASKIQQIQVYGAQVYLTPNPETGGIKDYFATFTGMQAYCTARGMVPMISARPVNPYMVEGSKTIAYEVVAELGRSPDVFFGPVGGGGMLGGTWKGFQELEALGLGTSSPQLWGAQRGGYMAPIDKLSDPAHDWSNYYQPLDGDWAWTSIQQSGGRLLQVEKEDILEAQAELAALEGIFAEPQGAYAAAGLIRAARADEIPGDATIVCVVTGMGLKDMGAAATIVETFPDRKAIVRVRSLEVTLIEQRTAQ